MPGDRNLDWQGTWNARDLGGLRVRGGGSTRRRRVVRSEALDQLTDDGWSAVSAYGVTTIVDLRDAVEVQARPVLGPQEILQLHVPIEEGLAADPEFASWRERGLLATPLYHARFLERWPERCADAVRSVALAGPGCVVVHCGKGCDRTGLLAMLLLDLAGVEPDDIADDFDLTRLRLRSQRARALGRADDSNRIEELVQKHGYRDQRDVVLQNLSGLESCAQLVAAGLGEEDVERVRSRFLVDTG